MCECECRIVVSAAYGGGKQTAITQDLSGGKPEKISFRVGKQALGYYPEKEFVVEPGLFEIGVGCDSEHYEMISVRVEK